MRDAQRIVSEIEQRDLLEVAARCSKARGAVVEDLCDRATGARGRSARYAFWLELVDNYSFSLPRVAALFGVHHTTVLYGVRRARSNVDA